MAIKKFSIYLFKKINILFAIGLLNAIVNLKKIAKYKKYIYIFQLIN